MIWTRVAATTVALAVLPCWSQAQTSGAPLPHQGTQELRPTSDAQERPFLGVYLTQAGALGQREVEITALVEDGPAAKAGLLPGDALVSLGDTAVHSATDVSAALATWSVGDKVKVQFLRGDEKKSVELTLGAAPTTSVPMTRILDADDVADLRLPDLEEGKTPLRMLTRRAAESDGIDSPSLPPSPDSAGATTDAVVGGGWLGVTVEEQDDGSVQVATVHSGSPAERAGLQVGDRLTGLGGQEIRNFDALANTISSLKPGSHSVLQFDRDGVAHQTRVILGQRPLEQITLEQSTLEAKSPPIIRLGRGPVLEMAPSAAPETPAAPSSGTPALEREIEALRRENAALRTLADRYREQLHAIRKALDGSKD